MQIAFVVQPWDITLTTTGGVSSIPILSYQMGLKLRAIGYDVSIFSRLGSEQALVEEDTSGIRFIRVPLKLDDILVKPLKFYDRLARWHNPKRPAFASTWYYKGYALQVAKAMQAQPPDIIHLHNFSQFVPFFKEKFPEAKLVLHMHCEWLSQLDPEIIAPRLTYVDLVLGCSQFVTHTIASRFPHLSQRCATVYNGVHFPSLIHKTKHKRQEILYVGRISPEKGVHVLIDGFKQIADEFPDVQLTLAGAIDSAPYEFMVAISDDPRVRALERFYGEGWFKNELRRYAVALEEQIPPSLQARIKFTGFIPHNELPELYQRASILVNPSLSEAFGMSLIEALSVGTPVVASKVGGMTDIIVDGENGLLVEPDNPDALATGLRKLLSDENMRQKMGQQGRMLVRQKFSWSVVTDSLMKQYQALLANE